MRPNRAYRINRLLVLAAFGALLAAGTGVARADGVLSNTEKAYVIAYHDAICSTIDSYPSYDGVMGIASVIIEDGFSGDGAADIVNAAVEGYCSRHWTLLVNIGKAARGERWVA